MSDARRQALSESAAGREALAAVDALAAANARARVDATCMSKPRRGARSLRWLQWLRPPPL